MLKETYKGLPKLPRYALSFVYVSYIFLIQFTRMADYAPSWGTRADAGGYQFSDVVEMYKSPDIE